ncbi:CoA pyrophosphatase [Limnohabitans sp. T6-20]|uniref:CoA pyrophosphatase n=1 Tax=Limnohabitans sp. T6-20 TaxID=1100725 RepID=UPI000DD26CF0|nr:CoA pyrophosphatase [Limnohabitans sp. T6-20]PUE07911.1 CoA pyrophosphatase [Limnohabitans sp. T6-20]
MPAVPSAHLRPDALKTRFAQPPVWQPEVERETSFSTRAPAHAAVLVPIVMRGPDFSESTILLTQRANHMSTHSGQIAFPGGKVDPEDANRHATALRETYEEVGLHPRHVEIIGELPVYVTGTAFWVTPVIALVSPDFELAPNADEVQDVFEVPLAYLMNPAHHRRHQFEWQGAQRQWFSMPYQESRPAANGQTDLVERFIWGATAAMLRNFYRFLVVHPAE